MGNSKGVVALTCVLGLVVTLHAHACGESMFRVGFGVTVPTATVQQPANVAIFKASDVDPDVFFDDSKVSSRLGKTGHKVTVVRNATMSADSGAGQRFDVVIARDSDFASARQALGQRVANAVFVPVHDGFSTATDGGSALSLSANAPLRQILGVDRKSVV